jgi:hypothetical protein
MRTNFRELNACCNCAHVYVKRNPEWPELYCNYDEDAESALGGDIHKMTEEEFDKMVMWEEDHTVYQNTICDKWEADE